MPKKLISAILAAALIASAGVFVYKTFFAPSGVVNIASIVPESAIYYVYSHDIKGKIERFWASKIGAKISSLELYKKNIAPNFKEIKKPFSLVEDFLENDTVVAIFSYSNFMDGSKDFKTKVGDYLLVTRVGKKQDIKKKILDAALSLTDGKNTTSSKYKGINITAVNIPKENITLRYAIFGNVLALSESEDILKKSIDLFKGESPDSLAFSQAYKQIIEGRRQEIEDSVIWAYTNHINYYKPFYKEMSKASQGNAASLMPDVLSRMKRFTEMQIASLTLLFYDSSKNSLSVKAYQAFDENKDEMGIVKLFRQSEGINKTNLNSIPGGIIACSVFSVNMIEIISKMYNIFSEMMAESAPGAKVAGNHKPYDFSTLIKNYTGIDFDEEVKPYMGNISGFIVHSIEEAALPKKKGQGHMQDITVPFPGISLFIELSDSDISLLAANKAMKKLVSAVNEFAKSRIPSEGFSLEPPDLSKLADNAEELFLGQKRSDLITIEESSYKGTKLSVLKLKDAFIEPAYTFINNNLVISLTEKSVKDMVDVYTVSIPSLDKTIVDDKLSLGMLDNYSVLYYFDINKFIKQLTETGAFKSFSPFIGMASGGKANADDLNQILDIIDDLGVFVQTSRFKNDGIAESIFYVQMEGL
ncbi:MAG: DUF3352 domain-containing protein [Candidatus Omnitrophota bacterium]